MTRVPRDAQVPHRRRLRGGAHGRTAAASALRRLPHSGRRRGHVPKLRRPPARSNIVRDCPRLPEITRDYPRLPETARNWPRLECRPAGRSPQRVQDCRARASPPSSSRLSSGTRRPSSATGSRPSRPRSPTTCAPCDAPAAALPAAPPVCAACPAAAAASGGFAAWTTWPQRTPSRTTATAPKAPPPAPLRHSVERGPDWRRRRARGVAGRRGAVSGRVRAALLCRAHLPLGASRAHTPSSTDTPTN